MLNKNFIDSSLNLQKITKNSDYQQIYKNQNCKYVANLLVLIIRKNNLLNSRYGIVVSSKIGNAIVRNHIKRQLRHLCKDVLIYAKPKHDYVIIARKNIVNVQFSEIKHSLYHVLKILSHLN